MEVQGEVLQNIILTCRIVFWNISGPQLDYAYCLGCIHDFSGKLLGFCSSYKENILKHSTNHLYGFLVTVLVKKKCASDWTKKHVAFILVSHYAHRARVKVDKTEPNAS